MKTPEKSLSQGYHVPEITEDIIDYLHTTVEPRSKTQFIRDLISNNTPLHVVSAFRRVDRSIFTPGKVPEDYVYSPAPIPISRADKGVISSISQPDVVATMTSLLDVQKGNRVLEVGGGSGYQMAILADLVGASGVVHSLECDSSLIDWGNINLRKANIYNAMMHEGDGALGLERFAPYDRIIETASIPPFPIELFSKLPLMKQLDGNGMLVAPLGGFGNENLAHMISIMKRNGQPSLKDSDFCHDRYTFVPLQGRYGWEVYNHDQMPVHALALLSDLGSTLDPQEYLERYY